nr:MAG TPA: hypothetical protein [Caudoviricetes sp.]
MAKEFNANVNGINMSEFNRAFKKAKEAKELRDRKYDELRNMANIDFLKEVAMSLVMNEVSYKLQTTLFIKELAAGTAKVSANEPMANVRKINAIDESDFYFARAYESKINRAFRELSNGDYGVVELGDVTFTINGSYTFAAKNVQIRPIKNEDIHVQNVMMFADITYLPEEGDKWM